MSFQNLTIVSIYDFKKRLMSEDLVILNEQRTIEHQILDNWQTMAELQKAGFLTKADAKTESEVENMLKIREEPSQIKVKVIDPGQILLGKLHDQSRSMLDLKKVVDFSSEAFSQMHRIAPVDTWAIFVQKE